MTPWTVARQAPLSMELARQEYWNGLPFPSPGKPLNPRIEPDSPARQANSLPFELPGKPKCKMKMQSLFQNNEELQGSHSTALSQAQGPPKSEALA